MSISDFKMNESFDYYHSTQKSTITLVSILKNYGAAGRNDH